MKLDKDEKEILESYENEEWESLKDAKRMNLMAESARNALKKDQRINIRLSEMDLNRLKIKAMEEGLPYQTLISSILHKFVSGHLKEA
jgi:predicted DNA binding CopG/RHH family protein